MCHFLNFFNFISRIIGVFFFSIFYGIELKTENNKEPGYCPRETHILVWQPDKLTDNYNIVSECYESH